MIDVYADESGTHDKTGFKKGSKNATVGGIAALREDWIPFCRDWLEVLKKYDAPYFHFSDWADASAVARKKRPPPSDFHKNPYRNLDVKRLNDFLIELATIAGSGNKLIVSGFIRTRAFHEAKIKGDVPIGANPYERCVNEFFDAYVETIRLQRPPWKRQPASFIFDQTTDKEWIHAVNDAFLFYQKQHPKFKMPIFKDKKQLPYLPLQGADMVAYRTRQITEKWEDQDASRQWPELDNALFKPTFDYLKARQTEVLRAYFSGELHP